MHDFGSFWGPLLGSIPPRLFDNFEYCSVVLPGTQEDLAVSAQAWPLKSTEIDNREGANMAILPAKMPARQPGSQVVPHRRLAGPGSFKRIP